MAELKNFRSILCYVNVDGDDHAALGFAAWMAHAQGSSLTAIDVQPEPSWHARLAAGFDKDAASRLVDRRMTVLKEKVRDLCADVAHVDVRVLLGSPWIEIIREVLRGQHDLVVKAGDAARSFLASPFSSTAAHLVRKCPCPVWLVKPGTQPRAKRILAAINPDPQDDASIRFNRQLVGTANSMGEMQAADVILLHVWDERGESVPRLGTTGAEPLQQATKGIEEAVTKTMVRFIDELGLPDFDPNIQMVRGDPGPAISEFARSHEIDLIVIGSMGRVGVKGLFIGNVAEAVLRRAPCSLLTVKPEGFVTPVAPGDAAL